MLTIEVESLVASLFIIRPFGIPGTVPGTSTSTSLLLVLSELLPVAEKTTCNRLPPVTGTVTAVTGTVTGTGSLLGIRYLPGTIRSI